MSETTNPAFPSGNGLVDTCVVGAGSAARVALWSASITAPPTTAATLRLRIVEFMRITPPILPDPISHGVKTARLMNSHKIHLNLVRSQERSADGDAGSRVPGKPLVSACSDADSSGPKT